MPAHVHRQICTCFAGSGMESQRFGARAQVPPSPQLPCGASALRVSRAVRSNLQADAGGATEYKGATAGAGTGDVQLHTPDAEVDFDERGSDAGAPYNCFCKAGPRQRCMQNIDADSAYYSMGKGAVHRFSEEIQPKGMPNPCSLALPGLAPYCSVALQAVTCSSHFATV